jgi:hypothetical protein
MNGINFGNTADLHHAPICCDVVRVPIIASQNSADFEEYRSAGSLFLLF